MKKLIDLEDPFFAPVWVRFAVVVVIFAWGLFELSRGAVIWATFFLGIGAVCVWRFWTIDYSNGPEE